MTCLAAFATGIVVTVAAIGALVIGGFVIAAQVNDVMREINRGQDS